MPRRATLLPYGRQCIDDDDVAAVVEQLRGDWLTQGPAVARFEAGLAEFTGARYAVAVSNGTAALHLACLAAGVQAGDTGLTSDVTFVASANAIRYAGGKPTLVDVEPDTGLISVADLERGVEALAARGVRPKVIIPVDLAGSVADLVAVRSIADRVGARVIEDAAHSLGATYTHDGRTHNAASCVHSDMAILSFHPVKHLTTGEGGAITTNDDALYRTLSDLRTHGITKDGARFAQSDGPWYYEQQSLGFNYRITDIQCALGSSQMRKLPRFVARRREIAARYDRAFATGGVRPLRVPAGVASSYHLYVVQLVSRPEEPMSDLAARRKQVFVKLREANIAAQVHYIPVHRQPDFVRNGLVDGHFDGANAYYAGCLSVPMFPAMSDADADDVIDALRDAI